MAQTTADSYGIVRGAADIFNLPSGGNMEQNYNNRGDTIMAAALPERSELVRMGNSWGAQLKEANAMTLLITIPTTLCCLCLQNVESQGGKSYLIDRVWLKAVTTLAAANYVSMLAQVLPPGAAVVADSTNKTIYSLSGKATYTGKAQICIATVLPAFVADKWATIGSSPVASVTTGIALSMESNVYGRYLIPPGASFGVNAQEAVSGGTCIMGIEWHEVQLILG